MSERQTGDFTSLGDNVKNLRQLFLIVVLIFMISCSWILPQSVPLQPATLPAPTMEKVEPIDWETTQGSWSIYHAKVYIYETIYDPAGYLWISSTVGVSKLDLTTGKFTDFGKPDGFSDSNFYTLVLFDGKIWVANNGEIANLSNGKWLVEKINDGYGNLIEDLDNVLWYLSDDGIYYFEPENQKWELFDIPEEFKEYYFYSIAKSQDGFLWFMSNAGVLQYDGVNWIMHWDLVYLKEMVSLSDGTVLFINNQIIYSYDGNTISPIAFPTEKLLYSIRYNLLTSEGDLWFEIYSSFNKEDTYVTYLIKDGKVLETENVNFETAPSKDIYVPKLLTPFGWLFTYQNEIYLYNGKYWKKYILNKESLFNELTSNLRVLGFSPNGNLWLSDTENNPMLFDSKKLYSPFEEKICEEHYYSDAKMSVDGKVVWYQSPYDGSVCSVSLEEKKYVKGKLPFTFVSADIDSENYLWVASSAGFIAKITPYLLSKGDYSLIKPIRVGGENVSTVLSPSRIIFDSFGAIWVYVKDYGIYRYKDGDWKSYGQPDIDPTSFAVDSQGNVWVGKPGKLLKHENSKWIEFPFNCLCPTKLSIAPDDAVWFVSGCDGVYKFQNGNWSHFTNEQLDGMIPQQIIISPDGAVWFFNYDKWIRYEE